MSLETDELTRLRELAKLVLTSLSIGNIGIAKAAASQMLTPPRPVKKNEIGFDAGGFWG